MTHFVEALTRAGENAKHKCTEMDQYLKDSIDGLGDLLSRLASAIPGESYQADTCKYWHDLEQTWLRDLADVWERVGIAAALAPGIVQIVEEILGEKGAGGY